MSKSSAAWLSPWLLLLVLSLLAGCSGKSASSPEDEEPTQLFEPQTAGGLTIDAPEHILFERATRFYDTGLYKEAAEVFQLLKDGYPFGPYAEFAEIKVADCSFQSGDYAGAALRYEEYLKQHPRSASAEYAAMQSGRSYQLAHKGVGRDASHLNKAMEHYDSFTKQFPNSMYISAVSRYRKETIKSLVAQEDLIIGYYRKMGKDQAVATREKLIRERWGDPQAILTEDLESAEPQLARVALNSTPQPPQMVEAELKSPVITTLNPATPIPADSFSSINEESTLSEPEEGVLNVECQAGKLFFTFEAKVDQAQLTSIKESATKANNVSKFTIPDAHFVERELSCEGLGRVTLKADGEVTVGSTLNLQFFSLNFPSRIVVSTL